MKIPFSALVIMAMVLTFRAHDASAAVYLEIDDIKGEVSGSSSSAATVASSAVVGETFVLDATKSADDGRITGFQWKQIEGPRVTLTNDTAAKASFVPTVAGTYVFECVVTDAAGRETVSCRAKVEVADKNAMTTTVAPVTTSAVPVVTAAITEDAPGAAAGKKGNVEMQWKVEEGEKAAVPGAEPDEIDFDGGGQPNATNFGLLLGGAGGGGEEDGERAKGLARAGQVLLENAKASDQAIESVSLNYEKITAKVAQKIKLFGLIPVQATATVEIDAQEEVKVKFPWWSVLASGKDGDALGKRVFTTLSNVLKTKHDSIKNAIGNVR